MTWLVTGPARCLSSPCLEGGHYGLPSAAPCSAHIKYTDACARHMPARARWFSVLLFLGRLPVPRSGRPDEEVAGMRKVPTLIVMAVVVAALSSCGKTEKAAAPATTAAPPATVASAQDGADGGQ